MVRRRRIRPYKRGFMGRFIPSRKLEIVTRKEEPVGDITIRVGRLVWKDYGWTSVSSTNISAICYFRGRTPATGKCMVEFISGKTVALYDFPFKLFEEFYYAHSKGTFYYRKIRKAGYDTAQKGVTWDYV